MTVIVPNGNSLNSPYFIFIILLIVILQLRERKMKLWKLIIMPMVLSAITIPLVYNELYSIFNIAIILVGVLIGGLIGFLIGRLFEVKVHEDGSMILKGSYIAVLVWIAIIIIKMYGKNVLNGLGFIELNLLTGMFLIMTLSAIISRRISIYWKYWKLKKHI